MVKQSGDGEQQSVADDLGYLPEMRTKFDAFVQASGCSSAAEVALLVDRFFDDHEHVDITDAVGANP